MRFPSRETVELVRREYPAGTLVELVKMEEAIPMMERVASRLRLV